MADTASSDKFDGLRSILGANGYLDKAADMVPYVTDWRGRASGKAAFVALPSCTEEVAKVVKHCAANQITIIPQGGNTGLVLGGVPTTAGDELVISLKRMNHVTEVDEQSYTLTCEAGCILQNIQNAASDVDRLFPLSLAAEGSCTIGGNISTNAGGIHVLRYGNMREQVLGLEVVMANGEVWDGLKGLRKDNAGYDLKQLFIGGEGTLGIVTKACLKLYPKPTIIETAAIGLDSPEAAIKTLAELRARIGDAVVAFEIFPHQGLEFVLKHIEGTRPMLEGEHPWYAIAEVWGFAGDEQLKDRFMATLAGLLDDGQASDIALAQSVAHRQDFWRVREEFAIALKTEGAGFAFDVSVPVRRIPEFIERAAPKMQAILPGIRPVPFGHAGDGNLHYNMAAPLDASEADVLAKKEEITRAVHDLANAMDGSIAAEHGMGRQKAKEFTRYASQVEQGMSRAIKAALDPSGLFSPGRILE